MPGIAGIIAAQPSQERRTQLDAMVRCMLHEPSYVSGTYIDDDLGIGVGWAGLPNAFSTGAPIWNATRTRCLIFSGENVLTAHSRALLRARGIQPDPLGPDYLLHLFDGDHTTFLNALNGWFSGVLIDLEAREGAVFNDRYGMHRLYLHDEGERLYFASEAKSVLAVCARARKLNFRALGQVFSFGCALDNETLFEGVSLLPPGSLLRFSRGKVSSRALYFDRESLEHAAPLDEETFYERLRETFRAILPSYAQAREQASISLTGGLDTRMIMANLDLPAGALPSYSFGGMYNESYDVSISREVARLCQQPYRIIEVGKDFLDNFPDLAEKTAYISDGGLDVTGAADLYVNQQAKKTASVRLTGNYGSEIMRGARHLKAVAPMPGLLDPGFERCVLDAAGALDRAWQGNPISLAAFKQAPWHHYNRLCVEQSQLTIRSPFLDNEFVDLMYQAPAQALRSSDVSLRLIRDGNPALAKIMTDRGLGGSHSRAYTAWTHLHREFTFKADYAFNYGMPQWLARVDRIALAPFRVERLFLGRHKFHHFRVWFKNELAGYVKDVLLDERSLARPYLNRDFVTRMVHDHLAGTRNYTTEITKLLTIELTQRRLTDASPR